MDKCIIKVFKRTPKEYNHVKDALIARKLSVEEINTFVTNLPKIGWGVYTKTGKFICAGYLVIIKSHQKLALFDSFVSNPEIDFATRDYAMDLLTEKCIKKAKSLNIKGILAFTLHSAILMRSKRFRFQRLPHTVISLPIE